MAAPAATPTPAPEVSKADKFKEIASRRTAKALDAIATIEGCTNTTNYEYTKEQAETILNALVAGVKKLQAKFENPKAPSSTGFSL